VPALKESVTYVGFKELGAALRDSADTFDRTYANARRTIAGIITSAARARSPVLTGTLRGTISPDTSTGVGGTRWGTDYGGPIHFGWPDRHIAAQPFARDAAAATEPQWLAVIEAANDEALDIIASSTR
jgi:hypothetical protein